MLSDRKITESEFCFFVDMANACRSGKCYLCGDIESLKFLSNELNYPSSNIYNALLQRHVESGSVMRLVKKVFILTMDIEMCINSLPDILRPTDKHHIIFLEHAIEMKWNLNEKCCLLAVNLDDCVFYELIAQYYFSSQNFTISFHCENGGGTTTSNVLEKCVFNEKVPTLCIADSDQKYGSTKKYPQKPSNGDTLKKIEAAVKKLENLGNNPPYDFLPLEVHEVENLIPICILEKLKMSYPALEDGLKILMKLKKFDSGFPILCYDLKKGFPYIKGEPKREYWKEIMLRLGGSESDMPPDDKPNDENVVSSKLFFPPLSCNSGLLKQANKLIEQYVKSGKGFYVDNHIEHYWKKIGEIVLTWGCTGVPMYA